MLDMTVAVEEAQVLQVLRDFLEESGQAESLRALEKSTGMSPSGLPAQVAYLRELVVSGNWVELLQFLQPLSNSEDGEGYKRCQYAVFKQRYLEALWELGDSRVAPQAPVGGVDIRKRDNERLQVLMSCLEQLKQVCSSTEDYSSLYSLVTCPSLSAHPEYSNWKMHQARLDCFFTLSEWVGKILYPDTTLNLTAKGDRLLSANRLIQLMAKGLLYEECEAVCMHRSPEVRAESPLEVLDLCGWMQHQPDSAFQLSPSRLKLVVIPHTHVSTSTKLTASEIAQMSKSVSFAPESLKEMKQTLVSRSVPELHLIPSDEKSASPKETEEPQLTKTDRIAAKEPPLEGREEKQVHHSADNRVEHTQQTGHTDNDVLSTSGQHCVQHRLKLAQERSSTPYQKGRNSSEHQSPDVMHGFEDNFASCNPATITPFQTTPMVHRYRGGRESSTPKPHGFHPTLHPSPTTSPVPYVPGTHGISDTPHKYTQDPPRAEKDSKILVLETRKKATDVLLDDVQNTARKTITFAAQQEDHTSDIHWPTATLLTTVSDPQVVRSVAFSHSGGVVAVGANSKTLRLCSTLPLTEERSSDDELAVFYHHPRYHKGSIYCLAWLGDSLLASGSNDQTIRLLSYNSSSPSPCTPQGQLNVHNGTVRDLVFLPDGHLLSGGAGDSALKLSDVHTGRLIHSFTGHTDQILSVAVVSDTIIVSGGQDKTVRLWDTRHTRCLHTIKVPHPAASLSTFGNHIAISQLDGSCCVHDLQTLKSIGTFHPHTDECRTVRYSPTGQWLLTGSYDGTVCVTNVPSLEWREVGRHEDKVIQCRWHSGGRLLVSTGADKKACFWKLTY